MNGSCHYLFRKALKYGSDVSYYICGIAWRQKDLRQYDRLGGKYDRWVFWEDGDSTKNSTKLALLDKDGTQSVETSSLDPKCKFEEMP